MFRATRKEIFKIIMESSEKSWCKRVLHVCDTVIKKIHIQDDTEAIKNVERIVKGLCYAIRYKWQKCRRNVKLFFAQNKKWLLKTIQITNPMKNRAGAGNEN